MTKTIIKIRLPGKRNEPGEGPNSPRLSSLRITRVRNRVFHMQIILLCKPP
jgi:hypothetical protein